MSGWHNWSHVMQKAVHNERGEGATTSCSLCCRAHIAQHASVNKACMPSAELPVRSWVKSGQRFPMYRPSDM